MQLHHLKKSVKKNKKRIGRGGKRGTYSGRGQKGQKSRAGRKIRPAARDLILRFPKKRGFGNKPKSPKPIVLTLKKILLKIKPLIQKENSVIVDRIVLKQIGLIPARYRGKIKIVGEGEALKFPVSFKGLELSKTVKESIKKESAKNND